MKVMQGEGARRRPLLGFVAGVETRAQALTTNGARRLFLVFAAGLLALGLIAGCDRSYAAVPGPGSSVQRAAPAAAPAAVAPVAVKPNGRPAADSQVAPAEASDAELEKALRDLEDANDQADGLDDLQDSLR